MQFGLFENNQPITTKLEKGFSELLEMKFQQCPQTLDIVFEDRIRYTPAEIQSLKYLKKITSKERRNEWIQKIHQLKKLGFDVSMALKNN